MVRVIGLMADDVTTTKDMLATYKSMLPTYKSMTELAAEQRGLEQAVVRQARHLCTLSESGAETTTAWRTSCNAALELEKLVIEKGKTYAQTPPYANAMHDAMLTAIPNMTTCKEDMQATYKGLYCKYCKAKATKKLATQHRVLEQSVVKLAANLSSRNFLHLQVAAGLRSMPPRRSTRKRSLSLEGAEAVSNSLMASSTLFLE
jgi:hypothetical protein